MWPPSKWGSAAQKGSLLSRKGQTGSPPCFLQPVFFVHQGQLMFGRQCASMEQAVLGLATAGLWWLSCSGWGRPFPKGCQGWTWQNIPLQTTEISSFYILLKTLQCILRDLFESQGIQNKNKLSLFLSTSPEALKLLEEALAGWSKPSRAEGRRDVLKSAFFSEVQQLHSLPSCPGDSFISPVEAAAWIRP